MRFVSEGWTLEQHLIKMQMLAKSMKGEEIARELIHLLSTEYIIGVWDMGPASRYIV